MSDLMNQMTTDALGPWQRRQAAMLLHYASLDYLKNLHHIVRELVNGNEAPMLDLARRQGRASALVNARWGMRDTAGKWRNAWPVVRDVELLLAKDIARRSAGRYGLPTVVEFFYDNERRDFSYPTEPEQQQYEAFASLISDYARRIDATLEARENSQWDDHGFACVFANFIDECPRIPKFHVRTDVAFPTGTVPPWTGAYVSRSDPNAALQFAWTGAAGCELRNARTFNEIGLAALEQVGRSDLWFNRDKMFTFATSPAYASRFHDELHFGAEVFKDLAPSAVAGAAFINQPSDWYFVEVVEDDFEDTGPIMTKE
jgi:hypothetical protein